MFCKRLRQPFEISERTLQSRGGKRYGEETDGRVQMDFFVGCILFDHLIARSALLRHKDQNIPPDGCRTGQTEALRSVVFGEVFFLLFGDRREMIG